MYMGGKHPHITNCALIAHNNTMFVFCVPARSLECVPCFFPTNSLFWREPYRKTAWQAKTFLSSVIFEQQGLSNHTKLPFNDRRYEQKLATEKNASHIESAAVRKTQASDVSRALWAWVNGAASNRIHEREIIQTQKSHRDTPPRTLPTTIHVAKV